MRKLIQCAIGHGKVGVFVLLAASLCFGQALLNKAVDTKTISTSATVFTHQNQIGELNITVEYVISGAPSITSIILQGCMRAGSCQTLNTFTAQASGVVSVTGLYDQYTVTPTWTGGTSPSVQINWIGTANSSPFPTTLAVPTTALTGSNTGAASAANVTLAGAVNKTTYLTGFQITGAGATAASIINVTVTGTVTGTMTYNLVIPAGATTSITPLIVSFPTPVSASGMNTAIVVNVPSFGAGNTNAAVAAQGFQQ